MVKLDNYFQLGLNFGMEHENLTEREYEIILEKVEEQYGEDAVANFELGVIESMSLKDLGEEIYNKYVDVSNDCFPNESMDSDLGSTKVQRDIDKFISQRI